MSVVCRACGGKVCEICGGCIFHGECSCAEDTIASYGQQVGDLQSEVDRLRAEVERLREELDQAREYTRKWVELYTETMNELRHTAAPGTTFETDGPKLARTLRAEVERLQTRIAELVEQADSAYAPYRERVMQARAERDEAVSLLEHARKTEAKLLKISEIISQRHGDDGGFEGPEDEYNDEPEVITIKRIFAVMEGEG